MINKKKLSVLSIAGLLIAVLAGGAIASMCIVPAEKGAWINYDPDTRGITRLNFRMECRDASRTICTGNICRRIFAVEPHYFIHLWGSCSPTDCDWGEVEGVALTGAMAGWYYFYYDHGFAKRYVYVRTYPQWPGWLRLWIYTDFTDPNRTDYTMDDWFRRP